MTLVAHLGQEDYALFDSRDARDNDHATRSIRWRFREDLGCLLVNCAVDPGEVHSALCEVMDGEVPCRAGNSSVTRIGRLLWLTPRSWILQCLLQDEDQLAARINARFADKLVHAARSGDGLCWFDITGIGAPALIAEGAFVSLDADGQRIGHVKRTLFAGVTVVMVRESENIWQLGIERSRARYVTDWMRSAALRATALG